MNKFFILFAVFFCVSVVRSYIITAPKYDYPLSQPPVSVEEGEEIDEFSHDTNSTEGLEQKAMEKGFVSVDYTINGYYKSRTLYSGAPPSGFVTRPTGITPAQLEQLHHDCINRINLYRSGALKFSNGGADSNVLSGLSPVNERRGTNMCSSKAALGDLIDNVAGGGGCAGAHANAFVCPGGGARGQNSCCGRGAGSWGSWDTTTYNTYAKVQAGLYSCLQQMWDEGMNPNGDIGHWKVMRSTTYSQVSCGFAWTASGRIMMTQDFYDASNASNVCSPSCSECGGSDGCSTNPCSCESASPAPSSSASPSASPASRTQTPTRPPTPSRSPTRTHA